MRKNIKHGSAISHRSANKNKNISKVWNEENWNLIQYKRPIFVGGMIKPYYEHFYISIDGLKRIYPKATWKLLSIFRDATLLGRSKL